jgi:mono/diheme cytochrome c family protein
MRLRALLITLVAVVGLTAVVEQMKVSAQQAAAPAAASTTGSKTQWDGIYTDEQASRGEPLYAKTCASCHGQDLAGTEKGPPVAGASFDANWSDVKLGELSERMRNTMPVDNPGSLTRAQNTDILAFMLKRAGAPAGQTNLPTNVDQLNSIKYVVKKPSL